MASHLCRAVLALLALLTAASAAPSAAGAGRLWRAGRIEPPIAPDAESRLETAERLIASADWPRALPLLQAMADADDGLVWDGQVYVPVREFAARRIAALPPEARAAYQVLYRAAARRLFEDGLAARSAEILREAAGRYPNTEYGLRAVGALAALRMDAGEFGAALRTLQAAGEVDVRSEPGRAAAVRTLLCLARLGRRNEAERAAARLHEAGLDSVEIAGARLSLADLAAAQSATADDDNPAPRGADLTGPALAATVIDLAWPGRVAPDWPSVPALRPVCRNGSLFVQRDDAILCVDTQTARLRWGVPPLDGPREIALAIATRRPPGEYVLPSYLPVENLAHFRTFDNHGLATLSCADGRLYAVQTDPLAQEFPDEPWTATQDDFRLANELRCFDAADGSPLWSTAHGPDAALRDRWFVSAPAVAGGRAHALSLERGQVRAVCLDAATGRLLWDTPIGAVLGRQEGQRSAAELFVEDCGPPAVEGGLAVYPTGRGLVAALDALDGRLLWIAAYPRADVSVNRLGLQLSVPNGPWRPGAPLFAGDLCIVAPCDSRRVLALSRRTGAPVWSAEFHDGVALLGVRDGRLYVQHEGLSCLDASTGASLWRTPFEAPTTGLGALGAHVACLPQRDALRRVELDSGRALDPLPWPAGLDGRGNLTVTDGGLALCTPERIALLGSSRVDPAVRPARTPAQEPRADVHAPGGPAPEEELTHAPTPRPAWEAPGMPVLPDRTAGPGLSGRVLVRQGDGLSCLDAATGRVLWSTRVPSAHPDRHGWGYPACLAAPDGVTVTLDAVTLGVRMDDGQVTWRREHSLQAGGSFREPTRLQMIRWATRGLPLRPPRPAGEPVLQPPGAWGSGVVCRAAGGRRLLGIDAADGQVLFELPGAEALPAATGSLMAVSGDRLCILTEPPPILTVREARSGRLLARRELPATPNPSSVLVTPSGRLVVAEAAAAHLFDPGALRVVRRLRVPDGIDRVLHADDEWLVVRTLTGAARAVPLPGGPAVDLADGALWADRRGDRVCLLRAAQDSGVQYHGPGRHVHGSGFSLHARHLADGRAVWDTDLHVTGPAMVSEPLRCGRLWLLTASEAERARVLGVEAASGAVVFDVELAGGAGVRALPFVVEAGRVVVGLGDRVTALEPGEALATGP